MFRALPFPVLPSHLRKQEEFTVDHVGCMTKNQKPWSSLPYLGREEFDEEVTLPKSLDWSKRLGSVLGQLDG